MCIYIYIYIYVYTYVYIHICKHYSGPREGGEEAPGRFEPNRVLQQRAMHHATLQCEVLPCLALPRLAVQWAFVSSVVLSPDSCTKWSSLVVQTAQKTTEVKHLASVALEPTGGHLPSRGYSMCTITWCDIILMKSYHTIPCHALRCTEYDE